MTEKAPAATECRSCRRLIFWARTIKGKLMPMDVTPAKDGTFFVFQVVVNGKIHQLDAIHAGSSDARIDEEIRIHGKRYHSHFSTCPTADQHRRAK